MDCGEQNPTSCPREAGRERNTAGAQSACCMLADGLLADGLGAAASGRGGTTSYRRVRLSRYYLELMASFTAMTVLDRVREKAVGGGTEVGHDCEHTMHPNAVS